MECPQDDHVYPRGGYTVSPSSAPSKTGLVLKLGSKSPSVGDKHLLSDSEDEGQTSPKRTRATDQLIVPIQTKPPKINHTDLQNQDVFKTAIKSLEDRAQDAVEDKKTLLSSNKKLRQRSMTSMLRRTELRRTW